MVRGSAFGVLKHGGGAHLQHGAVPQPRADDDLGLPGHVEQRAGKRHAMRRLLSAILEKIVNDLKY